MLITTPQCAIVPAHLYTVHYLTLSSKQGQGYQKVSSFISFEIEKLVFQVVRKSVDYLLFSNNILE